MPCLCSQFSDLELERNQIKQRSKETTRIIENLHLVATHEDLEHVLYRCGSCGCLWQRALAWNWGNIEYLFKVPDCVTDDWHIAPYIDPDSVLIWVAMMEQFLTQRFEPSGNRCRHAGCDRPGIMMSVNCLVHHIESIQRLGKLPATPNGRWLPCYANVAPESLDTYVAGLQPRQP